MLKLELSHVWPKKEDGSTDYSSKMVEFDYSHLNETRRDVVTTYFEYEGKKHSTSRTYVTFAKGLVLDIGDTYLGDGDSSYWVNVWDPIEKRPVSFGLGYYPQVGPEGILELDATPEVKAEYDAYKAAEKAKADAQRKIYEAEQARIKKEQEAALPKAGRRVLVVRGRKVPVGTEGTSFWYGDTQYGYRVGIELKDGTKVFTAANNVEVVDNLKLLEHLSELQEKGGR